MNRAVRQAAFALIAISAGSFYLFNYTNGILGPYGLPSDLYHEAILVGLFFLVYLMFQIYFYTVLRRHKA